LKALRKSVGFLVTVLLYWVVLLSPLGEIYPHYVVIFNWIVDHQYILHICLGFVLYFLFSKWFEGVFKILLFIVLVPFVAHLVSMTETLIKGNIESLLWHFIVSGLVAVLLAIGATIAWVLCFLLKIKVNKADNGVN